MLYDRVQLLVWCYNVDAVDNASVYYAGCERKKKQLKLTITPFAAKMD